MKKGIHDVLVLTPLNDEGKTAIKQAMILQKALSFRVFLLHILPPPSFINRKFFTQKVIQTEDAALAKLNEFVSDYFDGEIPRNVILKVMSGSLTKTLIKETHFDNFHFIILKCAEPSDVVTSSVGDKELDHIIGHAHCPVLSINNETTANKIKRILIPIDIAEGSKKRLLWASNLAKKSGADIQIISALNIDMDETKSLAFKNANIIREMLIKRGIKCDVEILKVHDQEKSAAVFSYMEKNKPDMVVIRRHHLSAHAKAGIGKFAREIIHGSKVPVFTVSQSQKNIVRKLK